jgi:hypothetical protein
MQTLLCQPDIPLVAGLNIKQIKEISSMENMSFLQTESA